MAAGALTSLPGLVPVHYSAPTWERLHNLPQFALEKPGNHVPAAPGTASIQLLAWTITAGLALSDHQNPINSALRATIST